MPDSGASPAILTGRPRIFLDGRENPALSEQLLSFAAEETADGLCRSETTLLNWGPKDGRNDFQFFDRQTLDFGKPWKIEVGAGDAAGTVFDGKVSALEGRFLRERPPEVLILAEDRLQELRMTRRTRTFENVSDADVIQQIASQHGLAADVDVTGPTYRVLAQLNQSDLAFLRERARAADAELWVDGTTLKAKARSRRNSGDVTLSYQQGLLEFSVMADLAEQAVGFTVSGWDVAGKEAISFRATDSVLGSELNGDQSGGSVLAASLGARDQQAVHQLPFTQQEAQTLAEAGYRRWARRFVTGHGVADCEPRIRIGTKLQLRGLGPMFEGKYYVNRVRHTFDTVVGLRTMFWVERPGVGR